MEDIGSIERERKKRLSQHRTPSRPLLSTHLLAKEVGDNVVDILVTRVGTASLYPVVELAVHDINRRWVATSQLGVGQREHAVAECWAKEVAETCGQLPSTVGFGYGCGN